MSLHLPGKRALITGGTRGIGRAVALALAGGEARVVTCYHQDKRAAESLQLELKAIGGAHHVIRADVRDRSGAEQLAEICRTELGGLDLLVNNAGVDGHAAVSDVTDEEWRRVLDTNLTAMHLVTQAALPLLDTGSSIVNIGASVSTRGLPFKAHYTAAKSAVTGWSRSLCKELGPRGIRVNVVAPGIIETEPGAGLPPELLQRFLSATALGRLGTPEDVANAVLYLGSDLSAYVSGATIHVDGGI